MKHKFVALCGAPHAGKTEVASILREHYGAQVVDDSLCLRQAAMSLIGLSWEDVTTQEGKDRVITVCGADYTVRQLLGDLGNFLESKYGNQFMPERAIASISDLEAAPCFVFPSVRKNQGLTYIGNHGCVIEITRPGCVPVHDFDHYDKSLLTASIANNGTDPLTWRDELKAKVINLMDNI